MLYICNFTRWDYPLGMPADFMYWNPRPWNMFYDRRVRYFNGRLVKLWDVWNLPFRIVGFKTNLNINGIFFVAQNIYLWSLCLV